MKNTSVPLLEERSRRDSELRGAPGLVESQQEELRTVLNREGNESSEKVSKHKINFDETAIWNSLGYNYFGEEDKDLKSIYGSEFEDLMDGWAKIEGVEDENKTHMVCQVVSLGDQPDKTNVRIAVYKSDEKENTLKLFPLTEDGTQEALAHMKHMADKESLKNVDINYDEVAIWSELGVSYGRSDVPGKISVSEAGFDGLDGAWAKIEGVEDHESTHIACQIVCLGDPITRENCRIAVYKSDDKENTIKLFPLEEENVEVALNQMKQMARDEEEKLRS